MEKVWIVWFKKEQEDTPLRNIIFIMLGKTVQQHLLINKMFQCSDLCIQKHLQLITTKLGPFIIKEKWTASVGKTIGDKLKSGAGVEGESLGFCIWFSLKTQRNTMNFS